MKWEYSPAPESSAVADIKDRYLPFIDGSFKEGGGEDRDDGDREADPEREDQEQAGQVDVHLALQLQRAGRRCHHQPVRVGRQFGGGDLP